jgi:hypothetical protein
MSITSLIPDGATVAATLAVYSNGARISGPVDRSEATRIAATAIVMERIGKILPRVKARKVRATHPALAAMAEDIEVMNVRNPVDAEVAYTVYQSLCLGLRDWNKEAGRDGGIPFTNIVIDNWNKSSR